MEKNIVIIIVFIVLCFSCGKKINCEGTVYSKIGHKAVPNVGVTLSVYTSGKDAPLKSYSTTTDDKGHFMFSEFFAKNRSYGFSCDAGNDGWFHSNNAGREALRHFDIRLK